MKKIGDFLSVMLRIMLVSMIVFSIVVTYHVMVIKKDYEIITNPEGPDTSDYFEELFAE